MQSPKFKFLQQDLDEVFQLKYLEYEWKKTVKEKIRKQLIFDPIEYRDYDAEHRYHATQVRKEILSGNYTVRPPKRYLVEKSKGLCRQMTLVHPRDLLVLERLAKSIYYELKTKAPSKSAFFEPDDGSFIRGFGHKDFQYGSYASWKRFQKAVFGFAEENKYVVVTDVANFYDFINFQHLRNIISSLVDIREALLDLLIHVLNKLTWTPDFMPLTQVGMPQIETSATRVLANAMLFEVDRLCDQSSMPNYARFMDDMDIGVGTVSKAKAIVRDIDLTLQSRQLRLNSSKTKILRQEEAFEHFLIRENEILNRIEKLLDRGDHLVKLKPILLTLYEKWLSREAESSPGDNSPFKKSNGSKIHKYILKLIYQSGQVVPDDDLIWLAINDPSMRTTALRYLSHSKTPESAFFSIMNSVRIGMFVDDASYVDIANLLLHTKFDVSRGIINRIKEFCDYAAETGHIGLHSAIYVASKFLSRLQVLIIIRKYKQEIVGDFWLTRAVAGISPIFINNIHFGAYNSLSADFASEEFDSVFNYIKEIQTAEKLSLSNKSYLQSVNHNYPQKLYFPKVLVLVAFLKNASAEKILPGLRSLHRALEDDPFFRKMLK